MAKFQTFLKRTGALMSVLVLLICCTVSALAVTPAYSWYMPFQFTDLSVLYGTDWSSYANISFPVTRSGPVTAYDDSLMCDLVSATNSGAISVEYELIDEYEEYYGLRFYAPCLYIPLSVISSGAPVNVSVKNGSSTLSGIMYLSFDYVTLVKDDAGYEYVSKTISSGELDMNSYGTSYASVDVMAYAYQFILANDPSPSSVICLKNVSVTIKCDDPITGFTMEQPEMDTISNAAKWVDSFVLLAETDPTGSEEVLSSNFYTWLVSCVQGFTGAQLWVIGDQPVTIGGILGVCFIVGLVFWFLKMSM